MLHPDAPQLRAHPVGAAVEQAVERPLRDEERVGDVTATPVDFKLGSKDNTCKITVDGKTVVEQSNSVGAICTYRP